MPPTICLNMIVKNESHIIVETLTHLLSKMKFDYWVISDTGSTDNTKELIIDFFNTHKIPGELVEHKWQDFAYNRTKALESAFDKTDFLFIFDADDYIHGNIVLPEKLDSTGYFLKFGTTFVYYRPLLISNKKKWLFKGVLHEFLHSNDSIQFELKHLEGDYCVESRQLGARSKNPKKYLDDAVILKKAFEKAVLENDKLLYCRYAFYCAQSFKDAGKKYYDEAIEWYNKCLELENGYQEKYVSAMNIAGLYKIKNDDKNALLYWYKTIEYDPTRIDGVANIMNALLKSKKHFIINALYYKFKDYKLITKDKLFINTAPYLNYDIEYYNAISSHYIKDYEVGYQCCKKIINAIDISNARLPPAFIVLSVYKMQIINDNEDLSNIFYKLDEFIKYTSDKQIKIDNIFLDTWKLLFDKINGPLIIKPKYTFKNKKRPYIFISFTSCKRYHLFEKTLNSILNTWTDKEKIDYWFCVDDNSCESDRTNMKSNYGWIDFYMKSQEESGHKKSMNIIWNKLNELRPIYWIHMEDDFLFYKTMDYVTMALIGLSNLKKDNVNQILFNRNYAETIDHYNSRGHSQTDFPDFVLHVHDASIKTDYINCHYWPHYSLRPSLIDVKTVLDLGNYDSSNNFFESDYANKWTASGNKSAFFNSINSIHIGKLTLQKDDQVKNAYQLNDKTQYNADASFSLLVINLERRPDRKLKMINLFKSANVSNYELVTAIDGSSYKMTQDIIKMFEGNDFGSRKGVIGCALTHYTLWIKLLKDPVNQYYIIMEDDVKLCNNFNKKLKALSWDFINKDLIFMGYHMLQKKRESLSAVYDIDCDDTALSRLSKQLYIGGTFCYSINKKGAFKLLSYIKDNGIKHGIDYLIKINKDIECYETQPALAFSVWNENGAVIDSDIQNSAP